MSEWTNQVEQHPIHDTIRSVIAATETALAQEVDRDAETTERLARLSQVVSYIAARLRTIDSDLVSLQALNNMHQPLGRIASSLEAYQADHQPQQVVAAHNELESLLVHASGLPVPNSVEDVEGIREATTSLRRSVGQNIRHIEAQSEAANGVLTELESRLREVEARVLESSQRVADSLTDSQGRFEAAEEARAGAFEAARQELARAGEVVRSEELGKWNDALAAQDASFQSLENEAKQTCDALNASLGAQAKAALESMAELKREAEAMVGVITDTGMVGGYQKEANAARKAARFWRGVVAGCLGALVVFAVIVFALHVSGRGGTSWADVGWRVFVATSFGVFAAYASRQADKHDKASRKNRRMELELASISPYLLKLPDDMQIKMKMDLAYRLFGQADGESDKSEEALDTTGTNADIGRMVIELLKSHLTKQ